MLAVGLSTQILGFLLLSAMSPEWTAAVSVAWVVAAQGICGLAKDLTKTASKSAIKVAEAEARGEDGESRLFHWVAWFTGSKNAMKGAGFFLGGLLLQVLGFRYALWTMSGALGLVLVGVAAALPPRMGRAKASRSARELLSKSRGVTCWPRRASRSSELATSGSWWACRYSFTRRAGRSRWSAPSWRSGPSGTGSCRLPHRQRSAAAPMGSRTRSRPHAGGRWPWPMVPVAILGLLLARVGRSDVILVLGLTVFGVAFAVNSSVHSYLILAYAGSKKAAEDVGFYYAANALGRFAGTLLSGLLFQAGGIQACLAGSAAMLAACWLITLALPVRHHGSVVAGG
jgi:hypothetical protein